MTKIIIIFVILVLGSTASYSAWHFFRLRQKPVPITEQEENENTRPTSDAVYITANPIDLTQIEKISKFRSCAGHNSSGHNFFGQEEADRSMKHYVKPISALSDTNNKVALYAPLDGVIYQIEGPRTDLGPGQARGGYIEIISPQEPDAVVVLAHINVVTPLKKGDAVESGQLLGYAAVDGGSDFDLLVRAINQPNAKSNYGDTFDSVFNHMTPEVLTEYEEFGLTKDALFFSKEFRDQHPCQFSEQIRDSNEQVVSLPEIQTSSDNWVFIKH